MTVITRTPAVVAYRGVPDLEFETWLATAHRAAGELAGAALERDPADLRPHEEIDLLRRRGLLGFAAPVEYGGAGGNLAQALRLSRIVAAADGTLGRFLVHHYSNGVSSYLLGTRKQWEVVARGVGERGWFQGSVGNSRKADFAVEATGYGGYRLRGRSAGTPVVAVADVLAVRFFDGDRRVDVQIRPYRSALYFQDDLNDLGPEATVAALDIRPEEVLRGVEEWPGDQDLRRGLPAQFGRLAFAHLELAIAAGTLAAATRYLHELGRPWSGAGAPIITRGPSPRRHLDHLSAAVAAGAALADAAAHAFQRAVDAEADLTAEQCEELVLQVDRATAVATEVTLELTGGPDHGSIFRKNVAESS